MKEETIDHIIDYLNGELSGEDIHNIESLIESSPEAKEIHDQYKDIFNSIDETNLIEPDQGLKVSFDKSLRREIETNKTENKTFKLTPMFSQAAIFLLLLAVGLLFGLNINNNEPIEDYAGRFEDDNSEMFSLLGQESSSLRIKAVNMSYDMQEPHQDILEALINTLHSDKSDNVRLAAAEALAKFSQNKNVRQALVKALEIETDEMIQISLIHILTQLNEKKAIEPMNKIIQNDKAVNFVKDEAHSGKMKLIETY